MSAAPLPGTSGSALLSLAAAERAKTEAWATGLERLATEGVPPVDEDSAEWSDLRESALRRIRERQTQGHVA